MYAHIETANPGLTGIASEYNSLKDLINLVTAKLLTLNFKVGFGITTGNGLTAPRPAGTSLPNFFADVSAVGATPTVAELTTAFNDAETAAGFTHTPDTNNGFKLVYGSGVGGAGHANYNEFCGLNPDGTNDAGEPGTFGQGNILPGVTSQWLNSPSPTKTSGIDWLQRSMTNLDALLQIYKLHVGGVSGVNKHRFILDTLPAPGDITVVTGSSSGEIDVTWTDANSFYAKATDALFDVWVGKTEQQVIDKDFRYSGGASGVTVQFLKPGETYYIGVTTSNVGTSPGGKNLNDYLPNFDIIPGVMSTIKTAVAGS
jgi:hypothetical protein